MLEFANETVYLRFACQYDIIRMLSQLYLDYGYIRIKHDSEFLL